MRRFADRSAAGKELAAALEQYTMKDVVVIGLPRGGVPVAKEVAEALDAPLTIIVSKKIPAPGNPEYAIGAITQDNIAVMNEEALQTLSPSDDYTEKAKQEAAQEAQDKFERLGGNPHDVEGKTVIIVDDGIATGSTMEAAIAAIKQNEPAHIVVAVPATSADAKDRLAPKVDDFVCLIAPKLFMAVGQFYRDFRQVTDEEAKEILQAYRD